MKINFFAQAILIYGNIISEKSKGAIAKQVMCWNLNDNKVKEFK